MRKGSPSKRSRKVRPLLLILLWVWAACVFLILDLFRNVSELDTVRPDAAFYRAMRFAGHKLVGEPYNDSDEFTQHEIATSEEGAGRAEQAVVSSGLIVRGGMWRHMADEDLHAIEPPDGFRGSDLEWRFLGRVAPEELRTYMSDFRQMTPRERSALLRNIARTPHPSLASDLIGLRARISRSPRPLSEYCFAAVATIAITEKHSLDKDAVLRGPAGELARIVLDTELLRITEFQRHLDEAAWRGVQKTHGRMLSALPTLGDTPPFSAQMEATRTALEKVLLSATEPKPGYRGGVEAIRFATTLADEQTREALLRVVEQRSVVNQKFMSTTMRRDLVVLELAMGEIAREGSVHQQERLAELIAGALRREKDARTATVFKQFALTLLKTAPKGSTVPLTLGHVNKAGQKGEK